MYVLGSEVVGHRTVRVDLGAELAPGCAHHPALWDPQPKVVDAEVGVEFADPVKLMGVPPGVFEHADLREPLPHEEEVAHEAGAMERARHLGGPLDFEFRNLVRRDRRRERHGHDRPVVRIVVVGRKEPHAWRQIHLILRRVVGGWRPVRREETHVGDVDAAPGVRSGSHRRAGQTLLAHPGGSGVPEGIPVEVKA